MYFEIFCLNNNNNMFVLIAIICVLLIVLFVKSYMRIIYNYQRKVKVIDIKNNNESLVEYPQAPGPFPWPVLGNLQLLANYKTPFQGFNELAGIFGAAFSLTLGSTRCLVVNNLELIREVLNQNGKFFGGRPDFIRYHRIFGGDRNNSLALCDWSQLQQQRRYLGRRYCSPRDSTKFFAKMSEVGHLVSTEFLNKLQTVVKAGEAVDIKPMIQRACANMFLQYMCTQRFNYDDVEFQQIVYRFDQVFWEINQGYAVDFLPWLSPFYKNYLDKLEGWSKSVRTFILKRIINPRKQRSQINETEQDFTDILEQQLNDVSEDVLLFMLEDFIGGHSAVGNLVMLTLSYIAKHPEVAKRIQAEIDAVLQVSEHLSIKHMNDMPYTMATLYETLRFSSSPIVPHVATENVVIAGYGVSKGTVVFLNNYSLNTSNKYWNEPEQFKPERFLEAVPVKEKILRKRRKSAGSDSGVEFESYKFDKTTITTDANDSLLCKQFETDADELTAKWRIKKNIPHFLPFSIGKRTCIGQSLVRVFGFNLLANIMHKYNVSYDDETQVKIYPACVALPPKTFPLVLSPRSV